MTGYALPHLPWLRAFEAAARKLSFSGAALELHVSPAAVSLQIRSLEQHLGFALFERLPRGVRLTDMGRAYLPSVRKAFDTLSMSTIGLFGGQAGRSLTIRSTAAFAVLWLAPRLQGFLDTCPGIDVRLFTTIWADGLDTDQADIDIRFGDGRWEGFDVEPIRQEPSIPVCSPAWKTRASRKAPMAALARQHLIHIMGCEDLWSRWFLAHGTPIGPGPRGIQVDTSLTALELASAGTGFAIVLKSFAEGHLRTGRLIAPFDGELAIDEAHYLLLPKRQDRPRPEVLLFREWLLVQAR
jgi:LysR family glycine cleavage system transcriptional activator